MKRAAAWAATLVLLVGGLVGAAGALWVSAETDRALWQAQQLVAGQQQEQQRLQAERQKQDDKLLQLQLQAAETGHQLADAAGRQDRYRQLLEVAGDGGRQLDENFTHYRNMLGESGRAVYDRMRVGFLQEKYDVEVPARAVMDFDTLFDIYVGVLLDDPGLFQFHKQLQASYTGGATGNTIQPGLLFQGDALETATARFTAEARAVLGQAEALATDLEKVKFIHDTLAQTVEYDLEAANGHEAYGAMVDKRAVCDGYAMAFKYYMNRLGIPAACVTGTAGGEEHAWNIVLLDGAYYNIDVTWDDPTDLPAGAWTYHFFLLGDATMNKTHSRDARSARLPACTSAQYEGRFEYEAAA